MTTIAPSFTPTASLLPPFISPRGLARWAVAGLLLTLVVSWIAVGVELAQLRLLVVASGGSRVAVLTRDAQSWTNDALLWIQLAAFVLAGITFLLWLYQARVNLRALGVRRPAYSRTWTWAGFLLPVLNFFRPYQVMREIWQASDPRNLDPFQWKSVRVPPLLMLWWATVVGWLALETLALLSNVGAGLNLAKLQLSQSVSIGADVMAAMAALFACFVVSRISDAQEAKRARQLEAASV